MEPHNRRVPQVIITWGMLYVTINSVYVVGLVAFISVLILFRGYIEAVREIEQQLQTGDGKAEFDDIVVACGRFCSTPCINFYS